MKPENGGRALRRNGALYGVQNRICFCFARGDQKDLPRVHNGSDPHGKRVRGHCGIRKITAVRINGALRELDAERSVGKRIGRFVEADMAVCSYAEKLQVDKRVFLRQNLSRCRFQYSRGFG